MKKDKQGIGHEHVISSGGVLLGVQTINATAAHRFSYWEGVDEVIRAYAFINPAEMASVIADNRLQQTQNLTATGSNKSGTQRQTLGLPFGLMLALDDYDPELLTDKRKLHEFMRLFPGLRTCRTV